MFTTVAVAIAAPTVAQYIFCISEGVGIPSPIDMLPISILAEMRSVLAALLQEIPST